MVSRIDNFINKIKYKFSVNNKVLRTNVFSLVYNTNLIIQEDTNYTFFKSTPTEINFRFTDELKFNSFWKSLSYSKKLKIYKLYRNRHYKYIIILVYLTHKTKCDINFYIENNIIRCGQYTYNIFFK